MLRRQFIGLLGGAASWPVLARAQQAPIPVVGLLRSTPAEPFADLVSAFREGLRGEGFDEGRNVVIEQRWADNHLDKLPALAADLLRRRAAVIVGNQTSIEAARTASKTIPLVVVTGEDPVRAGLVASLSRPSGNVTGVTFFGGSQLDAKRMEILHELMPAAKVVAVLGDPGYAEFESRLPEVEAAARAFGWRLVVQRAVTESEFEPAFKHFEQSGTDALLVSGSPLFTSLRQSLVALAARYKMPAIYDVRNLVAAGGLISYSSSLNGAYRQAAVYAGRILKGEKPSDLPVLQATTFQLSINLKTAKTLGLTVPPALLARADEVIE